jgi:DNA-binding NtrC family response regulator
MRHVLQLAARVAPHPTTVLVTGESGTGKEVVARAIHRMSPRRDRAFVAVNCAAIPEQLLESELFGHARGAFTGAVNERRGLFEEADGGTLLLDEIGELPASLQAKLLRVLQEGTLRRVGETRERRVDVRLIAATARDLAADVAAGRFREDLFYRLNVVHVAIPPLRERPEDVEELAAVLLERASARAGRRLRFGPGAMASLRARSWPGNVRELENVIERAVVLAPWRRPRRREPHGAAGARGPGGPHRDRGHWTAAGHRGRRRAGGHPAGAGAGGREPGGGGEAAGREPANAVLQDADAECRVVQYRFAVDCRFLQVHAAAHGRSVSLLSYKCLRCWHGCCHWVAEQARRPG